MGKCVYEVTPNPYSSEYDSYLTADENDALKALLKAADDGWDSLVENGKREISIERRNLTAEDKELLGMTQ